MENKQSRAFGPQLKKKGYEHGRRTIVDSNKFMSFTAISVEHAVTKTIEM